MKKIIEIECDSKFPENGVVIYRDKKWICVPRESFLNDLYSNDKKISDDFSDKINHLADTILELKNDINELSKKIKYLLGEEENEQ